MKEGFSMVVCDKVEEIPMMSFVSHVVRRKQRHYSLCDESNYTSRQADDFQIQVRESRSWVAESMTFLLTRRFNVSFVDEAKWNALYLPYGIRC